MPSSRNASARTRHHSKPSNNGPSAATRTPYCKICHDAGKPKSEYASHFVKDSPGPNGTVVCPYLLSLNCRYCHEGGHTVTHCQKLKDKNARVESAASTEQAYCAPKAKSQRCHGSTATAPRDRIRATTGFAVLATLHAESDPNADVVDKNPTPSGAARVPKIKPRGAWGAGRPEYTLPVLATSSAPLVSVAEMSDTFDESWMKGDGDDWVTQPVTMGGVADGAAQVCPQ